MDNNKTIKILISNDEIEGMICHRSSSDISIKIIRPYHNISMGLHIPYFARSRQSFEGTYGDDTAKILLKELYTIGKYIDSNMDNLIEKLNALNNIVAKFSSEMTNKDEFKTKRIELRKGMRNGTIDNKDYQKLLTPFRRKNEQLELKQSEQMSSFFEKNFPMIVPCGTREAVLDILKGKTSLKS